MKNGIEVFLIHGFLSGKRSGEPAVDKGRGKCDENGRHAHDSELLRCQQPGQDKVDHGENPCSAQIVYEPPFDTLGCLFFQIVHVIILYVFPVRHRTFGSGYSCIHLSSS